MDRPGQEELYATSPIRPGSPFLVEVFGPEYRPRPCHFCRGHLRHTSDKGGVGFLSAADCNQKKEYPAQETGPGTLGAFETDSVLLYAS